MQFRAYPLCRFLHTPLQFLAYLRASHLTISQGFRDSDTLDGTDNPATTILDTSDETSRLKVSEDVLHLTHLKPKVLGEVGVRGKAPALVVEALQHTIHHLSGDADGGSLEDGGRNPHACELRLAHRFTSTEESE